MGRTRCCAVDIAEGLAFVWLKKPSWVSKPRRANFKNMKSDINWREMNLESYEEFIVPNSEALLLMRTDISYVHGLKCRECGRGYQKGL